MRFIQVQGIPCTYMSAFVTFVAATNASYTRRSAPYLHSHAARGNENETTQAGCLRYMLLSCIANLQCVKTSP